MTWRLLPADLVRAIHDEVLNPGELAGEALNKSREGALARVESRLAYGMVDDVFDLAAAYAVAVVTGHCVNDANKRTAFRTMHAALGLNGVRLRMNTDEVGPLIVRVAQGQVDEGDLAAWLRGKTDG